MDWKDEVRQIVERGCTDSDIEDYIEKHPNIKGKVRIWDYVSDLNAPECCKGCKHVQLIGFSMPCTNCSRVLNSKDYYETR